MLTTANERSLWRCVKSTENLRAHLRASLDSDRGRALQLLILFSVPVFNVLALALFEILCARSSRALTEIGAHSEAALNREGDAYGASIPDTSLEEEPTSRKTVCG